MIKIFDNTLVILENIMPYIFGILVMLNLGLFGYYWAKPPQSTGTLDEVKASLDKPINFINTTNTMPPLIGEKTPTN